MSSDRRSAWLFDIITNAERISGYVAGMDAEIFVANAVVRDAVERCIERICEAVFRLGDQGPLLLPEQPLVQIRGMGNRLRHAYDRIDPVVIWQTVTQALPALAAEARVALDRLPPPGM